MPDPPSAASSSPSRVAIVSGASGAVGPVLATRLQAEGWRVALPTRSALAELREAHPQALVHEVDLTAAEGCRAFVAAVADAWGPPDAIVNAAGGFAMHAAARLTGEQLDAQLDANLRTLVTLTTAALPSMLERGRGHVLGVSAGAALRGGARQAAYAASKAAVAGYLRALRAEVEPRGLSVSMLVPEGTIDTAANREAMPEADPQRWIDVDGLADACLFLLTRGPRQRVFELKVGAG